MLKKNLQSWQEEWKKKVKIKTQNEKIVETDYGYMLLNIQKNIY